MSQSENADGSTDRRVNLHLDLNDRGTEADLAHGVVDVAAAIAEHHWRSTELYKQVLAITEQIERDLTAQGLPELFASDQLTEMLCVYDVLARQTARLSFALAHTLGLATSAGFDEWLRVADDWLLSHECGAAGHSATYGDLAQTDN